MPTILAPRQAPPGNGSPEYQNESNRSSILVFLGVPWALALVVMSLRLYVRKHMLRFVGSDDWTMLAATCCAIATYACFLAQGPVGLGRHMSTISPGEMREFTEISFYFNIFSLAGLCLNRVSLCLSLIRVAKHRTYAWILWAIMALIIGYHIACEFVLCLACTPIRAIWDVSSRDTARCISPEVSFGLVLGNSIIDLVTNVALIVLPIPVITSLRLNLRTKIALCLVNFLGFVVVGAAAAKLKFQVDYPLDGDRLYEDLYPTWTAIELYFGILAASFPTIRPLFACLLDTARINIEATTYAVRRAACSRQSSNNNNKNNNNNNNDDNNNNNNASNSTDMTKAYANPSMYTTDCSTSSSSPIFSYVKEKGSCFAFWRSRQVSCCEITTLSSSGKSGGVVVVESKAPRDIEEARQREEHIQHHRRQASRKLSAGGGGDISVKDYSPGTIVRTTEISSVSRLRNEQQSPAGKLELELPHCPLLLPPVPPLPHSITGSCGKLSNEEKNEQQQQQQQSLMLKVPALPSRLRKMSSNDAGLVLRAAVQSEAVLPRSPSIDDLMRDRRKGSVGGRLG